MEMCRLVKIYILLGLGLFFNFIKKCFKKYFKNKSLKSQYKNNNYNQRCPKIASVLQNKFECKELSGILHGYLLWFLFYLEQINRIS